MFNSSFLPVDSTKSNVHFRFDVLRHPRLFCFVTNAADTCKYATNETHAFSAMDDHAETSVLRTIKTKTVLIKSLFSYVRKFLSHIPVTCKSLRI